jgi:hypothetical protein
MKMKAREVISISVLLIFLAAAMPVVQASTYTANHSSERAFKDVIKKYNCAQLVIQPNYPPNQDTCVNYPYNLPINGTTNYYYNEKQTGSITIETIGIGSHSYSFNGKAKDELSKAQSKWSADWYDWHRECSQQYWYRGTPILSGNGAKCNKKSIDIWTDYVKDLYKIAVEYNVPMNTLPYGY